MKKLVLFFLVVCAFQNSFGQSKKKDQEVDIVRHQVQLGETVRMLSRKYLADPTEIYRLNKFATGGIKEGMVLQIPVARKEEAGKQTEADTSIKDIVEVSTEKPVTVVNRIKEMSYMVQVNETLYSISKKYNISVDEIKLSNQKLSKNGLKAGMIIKIPSTRILESNESSIGSDETPSNSITAKK